MTTYLYLSPHFDDAALSCGGMLLRHAERGEAATVLTVCAGTPDYDDLSAFARAQHRRWGNPVPRAKRADARTPSDDPPRALGGGGRTVGVAPGVPRDPIATRLGEDREAIKRLAAKADYLDVLDAIYRRDAHGRPVVSSNRSLFGLVHPDEQPLVERIAREVRARIGRKRDTRIVAPLAVGRHVDHQLVRDAARRLHRQGYHVVWYEDFPYAEKRGAVTRARKRFGAGAWSCATFELDVDEKIYAIAAYVSQMKSTFKHTRDMAKRVRAYNRYIAGGEGFAERVWAFVEGR